MKKVLAVWLWAIMCVATKAQYTGARNENKATIHIDATKKGAAVSPGLHGIFFEEISHGGDGGLYGELLQNRGFEDACLPLATHLDSGFIIPNRTPHFSLPNNGISDWKMEWPVKSQWPGWQLQISSPTNIQLALTGDKPLNKITPHALQVTVLKTSNDIKEGLVNEGFWGINVVKGDGYKLSFYACTNAAFIGAITASLQSGSGEVLAQHAFTQVSGSGWKKYSCQLKANNTNGQAKLVLSFGSTGTVWLDFVSLFPEKTFMHRSNGLRADLAQYIADLHPAFIRWPGGCFVEGINVENTPNWKKSLGPVETRAATYSPWGYWCSNGFGYHEYLQFCEDIHAAALYVFNIGVSCDFRSGTYIPDEKVDSVIADILDGIEYAVGPVTSHWGRVRAANGHPAPFPLKYIEVGNEQSGPRYAARYNRFYKAIKAKYPNIQLVASMGIGDVNRYTLDSMKAVDIADEHAYKAAGWAMRHWDHFDRYKRGNWNLYVGEYATNAGVGNGNMSAALSDAVYIMSMERNADLVKMCSYAPLLVNINDVDWPVNLINFDASRSFARISYYAIQLFNQNRADTNLATTVQIAAPEITTNHFTGGIGLGAWDTQTEYKDITVTQHGKVAYTSDFINNAGEWALLRGHWQVQDSALLQSAPGAQHLAVLNNKTFDTYTLTLKARKKEGYNAFIIPFAVKDSNTYLRAHIGSWVNSHCAFEKVTGGYDVSGLTDQVRLKHPIESNRWYSIRLEVMADSIACYLDDTLLMTYKEPATLFSIAGKSATGDIIVKMVNSGSMPVVATLDITPSNHIAHEAILQTIAAASEEAENSFEHPLQYVPVKTIIPHASSHFTLTLKPYSINVLRLRDN